MHHFIARSLPLAKVAAGDARRMAGIWPDPVADPRPAGDAIPAPATQSGMPAEDAGHIARWLPQTARSPGAGAQFTGPAALEACIADEHNDPEIELVERDDLNRRRTLLAEAIGILDERERHILVSRRIREEPLRTRDLAAHYEVSTERICQIEARAFESQERNPCAGRRPVDSVESGT